MTLRAVSPGSTTGSLGSGRPLEETVDRLARAALLPTSPALDVLDVAVHLGVERSWVYEHAEELGARRLGTGPKARLRFSLEAIERAVSCSAGRGTNAEPAPGLGSTAPNRRRRRAASSGGVELLPIRGSSRA